MAASFGYDVYCYLAGAGMSGSRWIASYKSLAAAKKRADKEAGYGIVAKVICCATGNAVYSAQL